MSTATREKKKPKTTTAAAPHLASESWKKERAGSKSLLHDLPEVWTGAKWAGHRLRARHWTFWTETYFFSDDEGGEDDDVDVDGLDGMDPQQL